MSEADNLLIADLAMAASKDALEAIVRKAKLAPTEDMGGRLLSAALFLVEAKARAMRMVMGNVNDAAVKELAEEEARRLALAIVCGAGALEAAGI